MSASSKHYRQRHYTRYQAYQIPGVDGGEFGNAPAYSTESPRDHYECIRWARDAKTEAERK